MKSLRCRGRGRKAKAIRGIILDTEAGAARVRVERGLRA
jgi:hypothetical protein